MRTKTFSLAFLSTMLALNAFSQAGNSGGAGATSGGTTAPATGSGRANQGTSQTTQPGTIQPGTINRGQVIVPQNRPGFAPATNQLITRDQLSGNTNQLLPQTNQFLVQSNQFLAQTNQIFAQTNGGGPSAQGTNNGLILSQDRAFNANDRTALVQIHRSLRGIFPSPTTLARVHFQVQQGIATIVGSVQTLEQKQRVLQVAQSTPNVMQVVDQLRIDVPPGFTTSTTGFGAESNQVGKRPLTPTGFTNQFGINPNAVPGTLPRVPTNPPPPVNNP